MAQTSSDKRLFVIDCDTGIDDAVALLMALNCADVQVLAITCVNGNCLVDSAVSNSLIVTSVIAKKQVPVYRGCDRPLLVQVESALPSDVHGNDGLGGVAHEFGDPKSQKEEEHAVNALVRLANEHKGQITLVSLGPLTNLAMAHRMDNCFTANLKNLVIMGGNTEGKGNVTLCAEFNFNTDPEAAQIVLEETQCPFTIIGWETSGINQPIPWEWAINWAKHENTKARAIARFLESYFDQKKNDTRLRGFSCCDGYAMAVALAPDIVVEKINFQATVETSPGATTRGMMVIVLYENKFTRKATRKADIILKIDMDRYKAMLEGIMKE